MDEVRDRDGKLICLADHRNGVVEIRQRGVLYRFRLPVGDTMVYRRGHCVTYLSRRSEHLFVCENYPDEL